MRRKQWIRLVLFGLVTMFTLTCGPTVQEIKAAPKTPPEKTQQRAQPKLSCAGVEPGTTGKLVADTGFRPKPNGFSFPNYGTAQYPAGKLTTAEAWKLFGASACKQVKDGKCTPTPALKVWVDQMNAAMNVGHCEGMAFLSAWFFAAREQLRPYQKATAFELKPAQQALLRSIAYYWTMQTLEPVISEYAHFQKKTPTEILHTLITAIKAKSDWYTLGLYSTAGGHAITPYAVEDVGQGVFRIYAYDNNYPCASKYVEVDTNADTWRYAAAAIDPAEDAMPWTGTTGTMDLTSLAVRQQPMVAPFISESESCGGTKGGVLHTKGGALRTKGMSVLLQGEGSSLTATNPAGQTVALVKGRAVNDIPGAKIFRLKDGATGTTASRGAVVLLPPDTEYKMDITGETNTAPESAQISIFQSCRTYAVNAITLAPGQRDRLKITEHGGFQYTAGNDESPTLEIAAANPNGVDILGEVSGISLTEGYSFEVDVAPDTGNLSVQCDYLSSNAFDLNVTTVDLNGDTENFSYENVDPGAAGEAVMEVNPDGSVNLGIDENKDGALEKTDITPDEQSNSVDFGAEDPAAASNEGTDAAGENANAADTNANSDSGSSDSGSSDSGSE